MIVAVKQQSLMASAAAVPERVCCVKTLEGDLQGSELQNTLPTLYMICDTFSWQYIVYMASAHCAYIPCCLLACPPSVSCVGLWLFSRKPVDPTNTATMRTKAQQLGFDVLVLKKVQQQGCTYPATVAPSDTATIVGGGITGLPFFRG
jgi:lipocalin